MQEIFQPEHYPRQRKESCSIQVSIASKVTKTHQEALVVASPDLTNKPAMTKKATSLLLDHAEHILII
jgi:hypothetical protein